MADRKLGTATWTVGITDNISSALRVVSNNIKTGVGDSIDRMVRRVQGALQTVSLRLRKLGAQFTSFGARTAGIGLALSAPFVAGVKAAGDFQETLNRFNAIFGSNSDAARKFAQDYGDAVGRSQNQLLTQLSEFGGLASGLNLSGDAAKAFSTELTKLAIDFASFNNLTDDDAQARFVAGLSGSSEVFKKFGIDISAAALKIRGITSESTEAAKTLARFDIIRETLGRQGAIGDAITTATSFNNTLKRIQATVADTAVTIGSALLPQLTGFANWLAAIAKRVAEFVKVNQEMVTKIAILAAGLVAAGGAVVSFGFVLSALGSIVTAVSTAVGVLGGAITFLLSPLGAVVAGVGLGIAAWATWSESGQRAVGNLRVSLGTLRTDFLSVVALVRRGDIAPAFELTTARMNLAWAEFTAFVPSSWIAVVGSIRVASYRLSLDIQLAFQRAGIGIAKTFNGLIAVYNRISFIKLPSIDVSGLEVGLKTLRNVGNSTIRNVEDQVARDFAEANRGVAAATEELRQARAAAAAQIQQGIEEIKVPPVEIKIDDGGIGALIRDGLKVDFKVPEIPAIEVPKIPPFEVPQQRQANAPTEAVSLFSQGGIAAIIAASNNNQPDGLQDLAASVAAANNNQPDGQNNVVIDVAAPDNGQLEGLQDIAAAIAASNKNQLQGLQNLAPNIANLGGIVDKLANVFNPENIANALKPQAVAANSDPRAPVKDELTAARLQSVVAAVEDTPQAIGEEFRDALSDVGVATRRRTASA